MAKDIIEVLVCTYQGELFIAEQLDSILQQSYSFIEIYVFDDCSTDKTQDIVKGYCERYNNIQLHENKENIGFLKNFENAISSTSGNYIALSDQDDIWHSEKLDISMKALKSLENKHRDKPALVHSDLSLIDDAGKILNNSYFQKKQIKLPAEKSLVKILGHCGVMGNTILMNRMLAEKALPFPKGLKYHDYWLALINELFGERATLPNALVQYRVHDKNTSNNRLIKPEKKRLSFKRDYLLPFMEDRREYPIRFLLDNYKLPENDTQLIRGFYQLLIFKGGRLSNYFFLLRKNFLRYGFLYRLSVFYRIMLTKRYDSK